MPERTVDYSSTLERQQEIDLALAAGETMVHDDYLTTDAAGNVLTGRLTFDVIPSVPLNARQLQAREFNDIHAQALDRLANWGNLTLDQKDEILFHLLRWALYKDGQLPYGL